MLKKVEEELEEEKKTSKRLNDEWKETEYFLEEEEQEKTQSNQKGKRFAGALALVLGLKETDFSWAQFGAVWRLFVVFEFS